MLPHIQRVPSRIVRDELAAGHFAEVGIDSAVLRQELKHAATHRDATQVKASAEAQITGAERVLIRALASGTQMQSGTTRSSAREGTDELAHVAEAALSLGALDVMLTPVIMKKGRPGTLLTVLCKPSGSAALERLILSETSTLGLRIRQDRRSCLDRRHAMVSTPYGEIRIKIGSLAGETLNAAPEFEDCRAAAAKHRTPVKQVQQAAIAAQHVVLSAQRGPFMTPSALLALFVRG